MFQSTAPPFWLANVGRTQNKHKTRPSIHPSRWVKEREAWCCQSESLEYIINRQNTKELEETGFKWQSELRFNDSDTAANNEKNKIK